MDVLLPVWRPRSKEQLSVGISGNYVGIVFVLVNCHGVLHRFLLGMVCHPKDWKILRTVSEENVKNLQIMVKLFA